MKARLDAVGSSKARVRDGEIHVAKIIHCYKSALLNATRSSHSYVGAHGVRHIRQRPAFSHQRLARRASGRAGEGLFSVRGSYKRRFPRVMTRPAGQPSRFSTTQWIESGRVRRFSKSHGSNQEGLNADGSGRVTLTRLDPTGSKWSNPRKALVIRLTVAWVGTLFLKAYFGEFKRL